MQLANLHAYILHVSCLTYILTYCIYPVQLHAYNLPNYMHTYCMHPA